MADRYLLESSLVDGYLLEDATGVLLLEVVAGITVTPGTASLTTTKYIPTVIKGTVVVPGTLALVATKYVPSVIKGTVVVLGIASLTTTKYAPVIVIGKTVIPGTASLVVTRFVPTVTATNNIKVTPGTLALIITRYTSVVTVGKIVTPGIVALITTRYTPIVSITQNVLVTPGLVSLTLTRFIPLVLLFTTYGGIFLWTSANWGSVNIYLETYIRATTGTVYARLIDSDNNVVTNSEVSTALTTFQRLRSNALTLVNGKTYRNQFGKAGGDAGEFLEAKLIAIPI